MKGTMKVAMILAVVFCFVLVQSAISGKPVRNIVEPIWKIFQDGTAQSVPWVDAANTRFAVGGGPVGGKGVLDKATGLVWEGAPSRDYFRWDFGMMHCMRCETAGVRGWRLPTIEEVQSLLDPDSSNDPKFPVGYPPLNTVYFPTEMLVWTSNAIEGSDAAYLVRLTDGAIQTDDKYSPFRDIRAWCVRGGTGSDKF